MAGSKIGGANEIPFTNLSFGSLYILPYTYSMTYTCTVFSNVGTRIGVPVDYVAVIGSTSFGTVTIDSNNIQS